jgi:LuxR family transcriptional regulator, maltose regulon positive regulatory protein
VVVLLVVSLTLYGKADFEGSQKMLSEAGQIVSKHKIAHGALAIYIAMQGFMYVENGQLEEAHQFFAGFGMLPDDEINLQDEHGYSPMVYLLIIEMEYDKAEKLLDKLYALALAQNRIERMVELKVLYAVLSNAIAKPGQAIDYLIEALEYAAAESIIMSFVLYSRKLTNLFPDLYKKLATKKSTIPKHLVEKLKKALEKRQKAIENKYQAFLSSRELETLRLMANNLMNQEIADTLFISLNTVKTHIKNIYLKLDVENRHEALKKASDLELL